MMRLILRAAACLTCGLLALLAVPAAVLIMGIVLLWRLTDFLLSVLV